MFRYALYGVSALCVALGGSAAAIAQNSSLVNSSQQRPMTLPNCSWTYAAPPDVKEFRLNDLVTVIVKHSSTVSSEGGMDRKKKANGRLTLEKWITLDGFSLGPSEGTAGSPEVVGVLDNKMKSEAQLETKDSIQFKLACRIIDIRPNGNLILEGHSTIRNNKEVWECSLTGEVRPDDVLPNNTVMSENIADPRIEKRESGHVRDGYRRGWMLEWLDKYQPF